MLEYGNSDRVVSTVDRQIDKALKGKWHRFNDVFCNPDRTIITCLTMSMPNDQRPSLNFDSTWKHQLVSDGALLSSSDGNPKLWSSMPFKVQNFDHICALYSINTSMQVLLVWFLQYRYFTQDVAPAQNL